MDDDKDVLKALSVRLKGSGYGVVYAADGIAAVSVARNEEPDVIILDIGLPGGDGFTVMERLAGILPIAQIPVIILTARDVSGNEARARTAGVPIIHYNIPRAKNYLGGEDYRRILAALAARRPIHPLPPHPRCSSSGAA